MFRLFSGVRILLKVKLPQFINLDFLEEFRLCPNPKLLVVFISVKVSLTGGKLFLSVGSVVVFKPFYIYQLSVQVLETSVQSNRVSGICFQDLNVFILNFLCIQG